MLNQKIVDILGLIPTEGDVGIEVEMELKKPFSVDGTPLAWRRVGDSSLKINGSELITKMPLEYSKVDGEIALLAEHIKKSGNKILESVRAGVHVHLNVQQLTVRQVYTLIACYYLMETPLTKFCGNGREDNLFCLTMKDAPYMQEAIEEALVKGNLQYLHTDNLRYAALNLQSLFKFGSVEFRALATDPKLENISPWVRIVRRLLEHSLTVDDPWEELVSTSGIGGREWMREIFGEELFAYLDYPELEHDVQRDARNVQHLIYIMKEEGV